MTPLSKPEINYSPFDREEKLGLPPWKPDDPKLIAWERAHGHDVRLKCYPEFGCQVLEAQRERIEAAAREVVAAWDAMPNTLPDFDGIYAWSAATMRLREALDG